MDNRTKCVRYVRAALASSFPDAERKTLRKACGNVMAIIDKYAGCCAQSAVTMCITGIGREMSKKNKNK